MHEPQRTRAVLQPPDRVSGHALRTAASVISGGALIASAFTPWGRGYKGSNIGADVLFTKDATVEASFWTSIGLITVMLGVAALVGLLPRRGWLTTTAGALGLLIFILFLTTHLVRADFAGTQLNYGSMTFLLLGSLFALPVAFVGMRQGPLVMLRMEGFRQESDRIGGTPSAR
jgi:hypothetical protein